LAGTYDNTLLVFDVKSFEFQRILSGHQGKTEKEREIEREREREREIER